MTYTLKLTKQEYDFVLAAIDAYNANLRHKILGQVAAPVEAPVVEKQEAKPKKRRGRTWTPEQRAKQAELVRQRLARANQKLSPVAA